jgi:hypothetical protein
MVNYLEAELGVDPSAANPAATVSYSQVNQIKIQFSEDVLVGANDLTVTGAAGNYSITGYHYEAGTHTAVWTLAAPLGAEAVTLRLAPQIEDLAGNGLDGDANGTVGGAFATSFDSLPGDVNHDRVVDAADLRFTLRHQFTWLGSDKYDMAADLDGNGVINVQDLVRVRNLRGTSLPGATPSPTPQPRLVVANDDILRPRPIRSRDLSRAEAEPQPTTDATSKLTLQRRAVDRAMADAATDEADVRPSVRARRR